VSADEGVQQDELRLKDELAALDIALFSQDVQELRGVLDKKAKCNGLVASAALKLTHEKLR
jgi:hypothetical protein